MSSEVCVSFPEAGGGCRFLEGVTWSPFLLIKAGEVLIPKKRIMAESVPGSEQVARPHSAESQNPTLSLHPISVPPTPLPKL